VLRARAGIEWLIRGEVELSSIAYPVKKRGCLRLSTGIAFAGSRSVRGGWLKAHYIGSDFLDALAQENGRSLLFSRQDAFRL
jgi:hypothetical protein